MPCNPGGRSPSGAGRCLNRRKDATYFCRHTKKCVLYHSKKFKVLTPLLIVQTLSARTASLARQPAFKDSCLVEGLHRLPSQSLGTYPAPEPLNVISSAQHGHRCVVKTAHIGVERSGRLLKKKGQAPSHVEPVCSSWLGFQNKMSNNQGFGDRSSVPKISNHSTLPIPQFPFPNIIYMIIYQ